MERIMKKALFWIYFAAMFNVAILSSSFGLNFTLPRISSAKNATASPSTAGVPLTHYIYETTTSYPPSCPLLCLCPPNKTEVKCDGGRSFLPPIPSDIFLLTYINNRLPGNRLTSTTLRNCTRLVALDLSRNGIKAVDSDAFSGFSNLASLLLDGNPIVRSVYLPFLWPLAWTLQSLSVQNVIADGEDPSFIWRLFKSNLPPAIKIGGLYLPNRGATRFPKLRQLRLGQNHLRFLDAEMLQDIVLNSRLELLSLAHNNLYKEAPVILWGLFEKKLEYTRNLNPSNASVTYSAAPLMEASTRTSIITLDLTYNNITGFSDEILHHSQTIWTKHRNWGALQENRKQSDDPSVKLLLRGNPIDCSCSIKTAMHFLFEGGGVDIIADWAALECHKPDPLKGLSLVQLDDLQIYYCHSDWGEKEFHLTAAQLAFIVICGTVLALVSIMVGYLNRSKFIVYWNFLRNCGNAEDHQNNQRWHGTLNKYSIPSDHRGIGHKGYYCDERVTFETQKDGESSIRS